MQKKCGENRLIWILCGWLLAIPALAIDIQVSVDRNPVSLNESFQITFSATQTPDGSPDFTPLQTNFDILNQQRSSNMSWVNGKSSQNEQWVVSVMPKQSGELLIPPIAFGDDISKPTKVLVTDAPPVQPSNTDEIFLDVEATPEKPYVQSQVLYTLKLYRRVQITQASLNDPEIKDALVEKLGDDSTYSTQVNGVDYWVTERKYAIFPQQSGLFTVAPLTLTAEVMSNQATQQRPRFNGFFNRQITETRRVSSKPITLNVQPVPQSFTDPAWLSAESLELKESWSTEDLQTKVGEPLTRTLILTAKGATVGQLPELSSPSTISGIKSYPDQPLLNEDKQSDGLIAVREEKIAYIASQPGQYTLPAINISWFNTKTQKTEVAHLAEVTLNALAASGSQTVVPLSQPQVPSATPQFNPNTPNANLFWQALSGFLGLGWLTHITWIYRKSKIKASTNKRRIAETAKPDRQKSLKFACQHNNPQAAKLALLQWGKQHFAADNLTLLAKHCSEPLRTEILLLNQHLYSGIEAGWQGQLLWDAFTKTSAVTTTGSEQDDVLAPLYRL